MVDFDRMTRRFLVGEGKELSIGSYFRALQEGLSKFRPSSQAQAILVENMRNTLRSARKEVVSLQEKINLLEERVQVLEENKEK